MERFSFLALVALVVVAGCGATSSPNTQDEFPLEAEPYEPPEEGPLERLGLVPDDILRNACPDHSEPLLQALIELYKTARNDGVSEFDLLTIVSADGCRDRPDPQACMTCLSSVVDLVYN